MTSLGRVAAPGFDESHDAAASNSSDMAYSGSVDCRYEDIVTKAERNSRKMTPIVYHGLKSSHGSTSTFGIQVDPTSSLLSSPDTLLQSSSRYSLDLSGSCNHDRYHTGGSDFCVDVGAEYQSVSWRGVCLETVKLIARHPLPILNISDHQTRTRLTSSTPQKSASMAYNQNHGSDHRKVLMTFSYRSFVGQSRESTNLSHQFL